MNETLAELIRWKETLLKRLAPISYRQIELVRLGDVSLILQHLGRKQKLLDEFDEIERNLTPFRDMPPEERKWKSEAEREETTAALNRCAKLLEEILKNDTISTEEMAQQKDEVTESLKKLRQGTQVNKSYSKQIASDDNSRFQING